MLPRIVLDNEYNFEIIYKNINIIKDFEQNVCFELKSFEHY
jgi:hypothetical protein